MEQHSNEILQSWISGVQLLKNVPIISDCVDINEKECVLILKPLSKLLWEKNFETILTEIRNCKRNPKILKIFVWSTTKNLTSQVSVKLLDHVSDCTVHLMRDNQLQILCKKDNVSLKSFQFTIQANKNFVIREKKAQKATIKIDKTTPKISTTFKIGDLSIAETQARNQVQMPYEK